MKACIACKYFRIDPRQWGSTLTGEYGGYLICGKDHFHVHMDEDGTQKTLLLNGANCHDYERSDLAIAKGWPEDD